MPDKKRDRYYLLRLRECLPDLPNDFSEPEPPDFVFVKDGHHLGIELTTIHLPPMTGEQPHQAQQSLKNRIVSEAERLHAEAGGPALYVSVFFNQHKQLKKKDIQPFAEELARAILVYPVPQRITESEVNIPWGHKPKWAGRISVYDSVNGSDKLWQADAGGWVAEITSEHISDVVRSKASREPLARTRCDELWLVIVNDNFSMAAQAEISIEARNASYEGPFDRLIWLLSDGPVAFDLNITQPASV